MIIQYKRIWNIYRQLWVVLFSFQYMIENLVCNVIGEEYWVSFLQFLKIRIKNLRLTIKVRFFLLVLMIQQILFEFIYLCIFIYGFGLCFFKSVYFLNIRVFVCFENILVDIFDLIYDGNLELIFFIQSKQINIIKYFK